MKTFKFELEFYNNTEFNAIEIMKFEGTLDEVFKKVEEILPEVGEYSLERLLPTKNFFRAYLWCRNSLSNNIVFSYVYKDYKLEKTRNLKYLISLREEEREV